MFAPNYHSAMRFVGPTRKKIGKRTIFNMIGPLSSPALVKRQVVGVFDKKLLKIFANALNNLDIKFAWIVNSDEGLDEISPYAKTIVIQLKDNKISEIVIDPKELKINADKFENLVGDDAKFNAEKMINIFINRVFRAIKIDIDLYEEVEKDKKATFQAGIVVVLSSLAAGVGSLHLGASNFLIAPALSLLSWYVWAYIIYFVGVKLFGDIKTKSDHGELLRTIGFSSAPGLIRVFGVTPELMTVTFIGSAFWMLACMVVAVKSALDYDSLWKAFGVVVVSWLVQAFFLFLIIVLLGKSSKPKLLITCLFIA